MPFASKQKISVTFAASLKVEDIDFFIEGKPILSNISFDCAPGEIIAILGPSGSGKSTLLRLLAGLEAPSRGEILLNSKIVSQKNKVLLPPERRGVGLIFQDYALFPHMTARENVAYGLRKFSKNEAFEEADRFLERVDLLSYAERFPHQLSGGEQQRVALMRAVAPRPSVLLMDEPFSGLDTSLRERVRETTFEILREARITTLCITHDPEEAMHIADKILILEQGRVLQIGYAETLYKKPASLKVARLFGAVNVSESMAKGGKLETPYGIIPTQAPDNTPLMIAVRSHDITLMPNGNARILSRRFLGATTHYHVICNDKEILVDCPQSNKAFNVGECVSLNVPEEAIHIFNQ